MIAPMWKGCRARFMAGSVEGRIEDFVRGICFCVGMGGGERSESSCCLETSSEEAPWADEVEIGGCLRRQSRSAPTLAFLPWPTMSTAL